MKPVATQVCGGRLVETAVGAHLYDPGGRELFYWREGDREVDYVVRDRRRVVAIEVTSGAKREGLPGLAAFRAAFGQARVVLVGAQGLALDEVLASEPERLIGPN